MIQGDSGVKVNILGRDIICYCENKKSSYEHVSDTGYPDAADWIYKYKSIVNGNREREINSC